jgi:hypothetical protein
MASFDTFMEGKFGKFGTMPERVKGFGYDPDAAVSGTESFIVTVDIGGGKGRCCWRSRMLIQTFHLTVLFYKTTMLETRHPGHEDCALGLQKWGPPTGS